MIADRSISPDGFSTGPNVRVGNGIGDGGDQLHEWMFREGGQPGVVPRSKPRSMPTDLTAESGDLAVLRRVNVSGAR